MYLFSGRLILISRFYCNLTTVGRRSSGKLFCFLSFFLPSRSYTNKIWLTDSIVANCLKKTSRKNGQTFCDKSSSRELDRKVQILVGKSREFAMVFKDGVRYPPQPETATGNRGVQINLHQDDHQQEQHNSMVMILDEVRTYPFVANRNHPPANPKLLPKMGISHDKHKHVAHFF